MSLILKGLGVTACLPDSCGGAPACAATRALARSWRGGLVFQAFSTLNGGKFDAGAHKS
jgi:hypothetical protein